MRDVLAIPDAADRGGQAEGDRGAGRDRGEDVAGDELFDVQLRGRFYDFAGRRAHDDSGWDGCKLAVTYHPAYLLRDPRQKGEAWKDLQMVMKELGLKAETCLAR